MTPIPEMKYERLYHERIMRSVANATRDDARQLMRLAGQIPIRTEVQTFPLEDANRALTALKHERDPRRWRIDYRPLNWYQCPMSSIRIVPRIRVVLGRDVALGPGRWSCWSTSRGPGSLRKAAAAMDMSYMRAWTLVQTMNRCFKKPLVVPERGGADGGPATVTECGQEAVRACIGASRLRACARPVLSRRNCSGTCGA